jgi:hypothetical protein
MATSVVGRMAAILTLDASGFTKGLAATQSALGKISTDFAAIGRKATLAITAPLAAAGGTALKLASDAAEAASKFDSVFGASASAVRKWSQETAAATRSSSYELQGFAARTGQTLKTLGVEGVEDLSKSIVQLGVDLADFNQRDQSETIRALNQALLGSGRALRDFGVAITPAKLEAELLARGIEGGAKAATDAEKALARYAIIVRETTSAQGEAVRSADSLDNLMQGLVKSAKDIGTAFGTVMLPAAQAIAKQALEAAEGFKKLDESTRKTIVTLGLVAAAAGPAATAISAVARALQLVAAGAALLAAHPVVAAFAVVGASVAGLAATVGVLEARWRAHTQAVAEARVKTDELKISIQDLLDVSQKGLPKGIGVDQAIGAIQGEIAAAEKALNPPGGRGNLIPGLEAALKARIGQLQAALTDLEAQKALGRLAERTATDFGPRPVAPPASVTSPGAAPPAAIAARDVAAEIAKASEETRRQIEEIATVTTTEAVPAVEELADASASAAEATGRVAEEALRVSVNIGSAISGSLRGSLSAIAEGTFTGEELLRRFRDSGLGLVEDFFGQVLEQKLNFDSVWEKNWLSELPGIVGSGLETALGFFGRFAEGAVDFIGEIITSLLEAISLQQVLNALSAVGGAVGGVVGGVLSLIGLAAGGIVTSPTPAIVGESGPEAVIPLERLGALGGSREPKVEVNIYGAENARVERGRNSRGEPRIDVFIEEVVNRNISRGGSIAQTIDRTRGTRQLGTLR